MVTWGTNTVHTFGAPAPAPALFGSTTSSPGAPPPPSFGGSTGTAFGAPSPTAATGGASTFNFSGSSTSAPQSSSFFGTLSTPAPSRSLFGNAPGTGAIFGASPAPAPGSSLFGGSSTSVFGAPQQQQQQQQIPAMPAQAAMLAHMDASARQETERVKAKLEKLFQAYAGNEVVSEDSMESAKFVAITYNELSPEERQLRIINGITLNGPSGQRPILSSPRPPQVSGKDWKMACVNNPDPDNYVPFPLIGAAALQGRVSWQQERAKETANNAKSVQKYLDFIRQREAVTRQDLAEKERMYMALRHRLLEVMAKVELARCVNKPLQPDEYRALQRLQGLLGHVERLRTELQTLQDRAKMHQQQIQKQSHGGTSSALANGIIADKDSLSSVLYEQRRKLSKMTEAAKTDLRDVNLIANRVVATVPSLPR